MGMLMVVQCVAGIPTEPTFVPIGLLNPQSTQTSITGLSGDGTTLVGASLGFPSLPVRWTWESGLQALPTEPLVGTADASAVSHDGSVIVGYSYEYNDEQRPTNFKLVSWTNGQVANLGGLPDNRSFAPAGLSGDGRIAVGTAYDQSNHIEAFVWPLDGEPTYLPDGGPTGSSAKSASFDGSAIIGNGDPLNRTGCYAIRWTDESGLVDLGRLPGPVQPTEIYGVQDISDDGSIVVGHSLTEPSAGIVRQRAYIWTAASGMQLLDPAEPAVFDTVAAGISPDGSVAVGYRRTFDTYQQDAVMWDKRHGMRVVQEVLTEAGVDLTGWKLSVALGASENGRVMYGYGENPEGRGAPWVAVMPVVPEPNALVLALVGAATALVRIGFTRIRRGRQIE